MVCSSWAWPNIFDVARNKVGVYSDTKSIVSRVKLLILTDPTELYMNPNFGVGIKKFMYTYNNDNTIAMFRDALVAQLRLWEPAVIADQTEVKRGLQYTGGGSDSGSLIDQNKLELTITLTTTYMQKTSFSLTDEDLI